MRLGRIAGAAFVVAFAVFVLVPVYWALLLTFGTPTTPIEWRSLLPDELTLDGWTFLTAGRNWRAIGNSAIVASATAVASVLVGIPAAYSIARLRARGVVLLAALLAIRLIPPVAVMLPAFVLVHQLQLRDTLVGLVLFYTPYTLTFTVLLGFAFFRKLPLEVEEAALVDGCTRWQTLRQIVLPLAAPAVLTAGVLAFVFAWTEFFVAFVFFRDAALTLPVHIAYNISYACYGCVPPAPPLQLALLGLVPSIAGGLVVIHFLERGLYRADG